MQFRAILIDSFRESLASRIFWAVAIISLIVVAALACIGFKADRVTFLLDAWSIQTDWFNPESPAGRARILSTIVFYVMNLSVGWVGVLLTLIATADVFPKMLERGAIDVILAKPIRRSVLFLYKYAASLIFVLMQAALFVGGMFLVMGLRWGVWAPGFLWSIPLLVLLFSYVYCVSVFVGVVTRSPLAAILISVGAWVLFALPPTVVELVRVEPTLSRNSALVRYVEIVAWIPPKTDDIAYLAGRATRAAAVTDVVSTEPFIGDDPYLREQQRLGRALEEEKLRREPLRSIGSSLLFEAVFVLLAMRRFCRRDF